MTPLPLEFKDLLKSLNAHAVDYMVIGGWAVIHYGYVRYTGDFDLWIASSSENADRLILALKEFIGEAPPKNSIVKLHKTIEFGNPPLRVHIMCDISGVEFEKCREKQVKADWDGIPVPVIGLDALLKNKKASARMKDLADVEYFTKLKTRTKRKPKK